MVICLLVHVSASCFCVIFNLQHHVPMERIFVSEFLKSSFTPARHFRCPIFYTLFKLFYLRIIRTLFVLVH
jgi:hypothetical protein